METKIRALARLYSHACHPCCLPALPNTACHCLTQRRSIPFHTIQVQKIRFESSRPRIEPPVKTSKPGRNATLALARFSCRGNNFHELTLQDTLEGSF